MAHALSTHLFWERFFEQRITPPDPDEPSEALEWYISVESACMHVVNVLGEEFQRDSTNILHVGCGSSELGVMLRNSGFLQVTNADFSSAVIDQMRERFPCHSFEVMNALALEIPDGSLDVVICKGMFDSITSDDATMCEQARGVLDEIARTLRVGGVYLLFSTFAPDDKAKPMAELLKLNVKLRFAVMELEAPFEIPGQKASYLYIVRKCPPGFRVLPILSPAAIVAPPPCPLVGSEVPTAAPGVLCLRLV